MFLKTYVFEKCTCLKTYVFESCTRVTSVEVLLKHFDDLFPISARMEKKSALCVFGERKRPVLYDSSDDWENEKGNFMEAIKATFSDLFQETGDSLESFFLQQETTTKNITKKTLNNVT